MKVWVGYPIRLHPILICLGCLFFGSISGAMPEFDVCKSSLLRGKSDFQVNFEKRLIEGLRDYFSGTKPNGFPDISFPGQGSVIFSSLDESTGQSLQRYADGLSDKHLRAFKAGCASALAQLDLNNPLELEVARTLLEVAERLKAREFISALAEISFPLHSSAKITDFFREAVIFACRETETTPLAASAKFLHRIANAPEYRKLSPSGWLTVGLAYAEPSSFGTNFSLVRDLLERRYGERGGEWIIDSLREAGVDEAVIKHPAPDPPDWWARMVRDADSNLEIDLSYQSRVRRRGTDLSNFERAWNDLYAKLPANIAGKIIGGTEQLGFKDTLEFTIYFKADSENETPVKIEKFVGDPYVRNDRLIMPWWFHDHFVLSRRK